jgi:hypothetical protein
VFIIMCMCVQPGPNKMPSTVAEEMEKLRVQLQEAELKAKNLEEQQRVAAEEGFRQGVVSTTTACTATLPAVTEDPISI